MKNKKILDLIESPEDLHALNAEELSILADEIREKIVSTTSKNGGHVASSLGAVEIILAVHSLIHSPKDKFVFDVGHQSYAHKLVSGRSKDFDNMRKFGGISGFPKPAESPHDTHYSGHSSDSLSIAMGLALAKLQRGSDEKIVALIGDASIAGGMSFEALNHIGQEQLPMVIILNENNRSISPTVGGLKTHLYGLRISENYRATSGKIKEHLSHLGNLGDKAIRLGSLSKGSLKQFLLPDTMLFEHLGIVCTQAIDGHDIYGLREVLKKALRSKGPILVHVVTEKGAGYKPAFIEPERFHGTGPYSISTGKPKGKPEYTFTNAFSEAIIYEAKNDDKIVAMTAAMSSGTGLKEFCNKFPSRFIDVGIAEQHLLGSAAGLATGGAKPVIAVYSTFLQRAIDQLIINVALPKLDVVVCVDRAGIVGADGVTHHGFFDIAYGRMVPNITLVTPSSAYELKCALHSAIKLGGPWMIRYPRGCAREISDSGHILKNPIKKQPKVFEPGKSREIIKGDDVSILAFGESVADAIQASANLSKKNISARVIDMRYAKPLDVDAVASAALETHRIITVEDGVINGGAGSGVLSELSRMNLLNVTKFKALGIDDQFITHGDVKSLKKIAKIDAASIVKAVLSLK